MGNKKLGEIKDELRKRFRKEGSTATGWFEKQIRKLNGQQPPDQKKLELLVALRDTLLAETAKRKKPEKKARRSVAR